MFDQIDGLPEKPLTHQVNTTTPGAILLAARQARGMEIAEVASKLKLSQQAIVDIEEDTLRHSDTLIYTRGYIRSYAKLLSLKPETVLAAFDEVYKTKVAPSLPAEEDGLINQPIVDRIRSPRNTRRMVRWGGVVLGVVMILMVVIWWNDQRHQVVSQPATVALPKSVAAIVEPATVPVKTSSPVLAQVKKIKVVAPKITKPIQKPSPVTANYSVVKVEQTTH